MPLYYFDSRDNGVLVKDEDGIDFRDLDGVQEAAAKAVVELALEVVPGSTDRNIAIEVRNGNGVQVVRASLTFRLESTG